ncbi:synaptojanin-2-binding protein-like [Clavelina lepadiformis]|uniref:synaptojanin-2-binding protein-like n=1 Tax=Clavelina lepadiformis TaxID=159417 RepID=UPI00404247FC
MSKSKPQFVEIILSRGPNGLGFNIRGGSDQPHLPNDKGIFVTKIRTNCSAAKDGRLQEGDKIIEINGNSLLDAKHATAVDYFINAGETVKLLVWHGAEKVLVEEYTEKTRQKGMSMFQKALLVAGVAVVLGVAFYYYKKHYGVAL